MKFTFLFLLLLFAKFSSANNLVFDTVLLINANDASTYTVPSGQTWEIVSVTGSPNNFSGVSSSFITINGQAAILQSTLGTTTSPYGAISYFSPMWLPAGTTIKTNNNFISILEYTIGP